MSRRTPLTLTEILDNQRVACARAGSQLYATVLAAVIDDVSAGGACSAVLGPHEGDSFASALPLRFLGAVHRLVLEGRAQALAAHYPSAGGTPGPSLMADFLATVAELRPAIEERIGDAVQTNEVGRSAVLTPGYALVARRSGLPLRVLEVGASGGLNLRWDHYWYDTGASSLGDPDSPVRFERVWQASGPGSGPAAATSAGRPAGGDPGAGLPDLRGPLDGPVTVVERAGCDRHPIDVGGDEGRVTLRAYLWPDQVERRARLEAAFAVAARHPVDVAADDLGAWAERRLAEPAPGVATVVAHSIVWQYVPRPSRDRLRAAPRRSAGAHPNRRARRGTPRWRAPTRPLPATT